MQVNHKAVDLVLNIIDLERKRKEMNSEFPTGESARAVYSAHHVQQAVNELKRIPEEMKAGKCSEQELEIRLERALSEIAQSWHVRGMTRQQYERLSSDDIEWMRQSIPNLSSILSRPFQIVDGESKINPANSEH